MSPKLMSLCSKHDLSEKTDRLEQSMAEESLMLKAKHSSRLYTEGRRVLMQRMCQL